MSNTNEPAESEPQTVAQLAASLQRQVIRLEDQLATERRKFKERLPGEIEYALNALRARCVIPLYVGEPRYFHKIAEDLHRDGSEVEHIRKVFHKVWNIHDAPLSDQQKMDIVEITGSGTNRWPGITRTDADFSDPTPYQDKQESGEAARPTDEPIALLGAAPTLTGMGRLRLKYHSVSGALLFVGAVLALLAPSTKEVLLNQLPALMIAMYMAAVASFCFAASHFFSHPFRSLEPEKIVSLDAALSHNLQTERYRAEIVNQGRDFYKFDALVVDEYIYEDRMHQIDLNTRQQQEKAQHKIKQIRPEFATTTPVRAGKASG